MKNITLLIAALFIVNLSFGQKDSTQQTEKQFQTIFGKSGEKTKVSGFGAFMMDFGSIENNFGLNLGLDGAVLINRSFFMGIYGRALVTAPSYNYISFDSDKKKVEMNQNAFFGHGGLLIGYVFAPTRPIHFGFSTRFGMGGISLYDDYQHGNYDPASNHYKDSPYIAPLYVFSPQFDVEMNVTSWFKFRLSAGYQFVSNASLEVKTIENGKYIQKEILNTSSFNTPTLSLGFVFGMFK